MSTPPSRRSRKRLATRQAISDAATRLFFDRGFDQVTVEEIAEAADVSRVTVFNHFRRKEDMFFDLDQAWRDDILNAVRARAPGVSPVEAFRRFAHEAVEQKKSYIEFSAHSERFNQALESSEPLKARWRAIRDEAAEALAGVLGEAAGIGHLNMDAHFAAHLLAATWTAAMTQGYAAFRASHSSQTAEGTFLALAERGCAGISLAMSGTPYA